MHKDNLVAWTQFELMMRTGVPHAMDIASELVRTNLEVPLPTNYQKPEIDLQFYCAIHRAYRAQVLTAFLTVMEQLKASDEWPVVQGSQAIQMEIVSLCQESRKLSRLDLLTLVKTQIVSPACSRWVA